MLLHDVYTYIYTGTNVLFYMIYEHVKLEILVHVRDTEYFVPPASTLAEEDNKVD